MPLVRFTAGIERHVTCELRESPGATVREVLDHYFQKTPRPRSYVLCDQGGLRKHMTVSVSRTNQPRRIWLGTGRAASSAQTIKAMPGP